MNSPIFSHTAWNCYPNKSYNIHQYILLLQSILYTPTPTETLVPRQGRIPKPKPIQYFLYRNGFPPLNRQLSQNHASKHEAKLWSVSLHKPPSQSIPGGRSHQKTEHNNNENRKSNEKTQHGLHSSFYGLSSNLLSHPKVSSIGIYLSGCVDQVTNFDQSTEA